MTRDHQLLAQLRTYEPADGIEAGHRQAMVNLLTTSATPFSRRQFAPGHFTASCFILDGQGRLLLHHHARLQRWLQMGGHVEGHESPDLAALREGFEESGLSDLELIGEGIFDLDVHAIPAGRGEPDHEHFDVRYAARTADAGRADSSDMAWVTLERAAELMPGDESLRVFRKLRERSLI